jgi:hypothetical protein
MTAEKFVKKIYPFAKAYSLAYHNGVPTTNVWAIGDMGNQHSIWMTTADTPQKSWILAKDILQKEFLDKLEQ